MRCVCGICSLYRYLSLWCVFASVPLRGGSDMCMCVCVGISQAEEGSGGGLE